MTWTISRKVSAGVLLVVLSIVLLASIGYASNTNYVDSINQQVQAHDATLGFANLKEEIEEMQQGAQGYLLTGDEDALDHFNRARDAVEPELLLLRQWAGADAAKQQRIDEIDSMMSRTVAAGQELIDLRRSRGAEAATLAAPLVAQGLGDTDQLEEILIGLKEQESAVLEQRVSSTRDSESFVRFGMPVIVLLTIISVVIIAVFLTRNIVRPLTELTAAAEQMAAGHLDVEIADYQRGDELGTLARKFKEMMIRQKEVIGEIREAAAANASSTSQILTSTNQVASSVSQTAAAVNETTATVEEVKQTSLLSSEKSKNVSEIAQRTSTASQGGMDSVQRLIAGLNRIQEQMGAIAETVVRLSEQNQAIAGIIATVNDLADQANLLSVNASVEAAKAGEQGKGFAVVAQEIRRLAEQSKQASAQVRDILNDIQKAMSAAVMATEQGDKAVEAGVKQSLQAEETIRVLMGSIDDSARSAIQIEASSKQQLTGMDQVALAMESIKEASAQNATSLKEVESTVQSLHEYGQRLKGLVEQYQV